MSTRWKRGLITAPLPALGMLLAVPATAQEFPDPGRDMSGQMDTATKIPKPDDDKEGNSRDLLIVPIPQSSPSLGFGITLVGAMFYNPNNSPEPWITGVGVMRTANGSKGIGLMHKMMLDDDKYRLTVFGGHADVNIDFFGIGPDAGERGRSIELNEKGIAGIVQGEMRVIPNVYFGGRVIYLDLSTSINREEPAFPNEEIPTREFDSTLAEIGPVFTYDRRDNSLEPKDGELITAAWMFGADALGSDFTHDKFTLAGNVYRKLGTTTVIAVRAAYCAVSRGGPI